MNNKYMLSLVSAATVISGIAHAQDIAWTGLGDGTTWEDVDNWDNGTFYPGQAGWSSGVIVPPDTSPNGNVQIDATDALTISSALPVTAYSVLLFGGSITLDNVTADVTWRQPEIRGQAGPSSVNIDAGVLNLVNGGQDIRLGRSFGFTTQSTTFNVGGGSLVGGNGARFKLGGYETSFNVTSGSVDLADSLEFGPNAAAGVANLSVNITGSAATLFNVGSIVTDDVAASNTLRFTTDAAGVTPLTVDTLLELDSLLDLEVDLANYNIVNGTELTLVTFDTISGTFGDVSILNGSGTLNYNPNSITLTIPEPSSAGMLAGILATSIVFMRRRKQ